MLRRSQPPRRRPPVPQVRYADAQPPRDSGDERGARPPWWRSKPVELFGADLRSLALFRMVIAAIALFDLVTRTAYLSAHYTDQGVLPRAFLIEEMHPWQLSLNMLSGAGSVQALIFGIGALAALGMLVGFRTRTMTIILWVVMMSIDWRNPYVLNAADTLLRLLLFWGVFLPLGAYWSVDRAVDRKGSNDRLAMGFLSMATAALFLQIAFMYVFTAILKSGREWRVDGTALYYALSLDQLAPPFGAWLLQFPTVLKVMTFATIGLEALGPFLLFFPLRTGPVRTATVAAFMSLHVGIMLTMDIGFFPWLSALCMVSFLPTWFWDRVLAPHRALVPTRLSLALRLRAALARLGAVAWLPPRVRPVVWASSGQPSLTPMAANWDDDHPRAGALFTPESALVGDAVDVPAPAAGPTVLRSALLTNVVVAFFLVYVFAWNVAVVTDAAMPASVRPVAQLFGLKQNWSMFAPRPTMRAGWFVLPATLEDGRQVDLLQPIIRNDPNLLPGVAWEQPRHLAYAYGETERWRKFLWSLINDEGDERRHQFAAYICRAWNGSHGGPLALNTFQIVYMTEQTLPDSQVAEPQRHTLTTYACDGTQLATIDD